MSLKKQIREAYEREAKTYDMTRAIFEKGRFGYRERNLLGEFLAKKSLILFLACGTGRHFNFIANQLGSEVIGVDLSVNMLKIAKKKQNIHLIAADVENLPFRQNTFDAAVCSRALYLFDNKFKVLQEAYAVLERSGKLMISTVFKDLLLTRFAIRIGLLTRDPLQYPYTSKQLAEMFRRANFRNLKRRCIVILSGDTRARILIPPAILRIINMVEDRLKGGRWGMVIGQK